MFLETFTTGPFKTNGYLLGLSDSGLVIDAPMDSADLIMAHAKKLNLNVQAILLTHTHLDHIADAARFQNDWKVPLWVHPADAPNLENPGIDGIPLYFPVPKATPDRLFTPDEIIHIGPFHFQVIETPGHSPGGVCFHFQELKILFSGDTLFKDGYGNLNFPTANPTAMWRSLKKLSHLPEETIVYPGHGEPTTIAMEDQWKDYS